MKGVLLHFFIFSFPSLLHKRLVSSPTFNSVTLWHHTASPCHTFALFIPRAALLMFFQTCASWPIRGDWGFWRRGLKETGVFQTEGEHRAAAPVCRKLMRFLSNKECKPILGIFQNTTMNLSSFHATGRQEHSPTFPLHAITTNNMLWSLTYTVLTGNIKVILAFDLFIMKAKWYCRHLSTKLNDFVCWCWSKTSLDLFYSILWHCTSLRRINYKIITFLGKYNYTATMDSLWETCK